MTRREREVTDINDILQIINETKILHLGLSDEIGRASCRERV